jgi:hypothetical protein
VILLLNNHYCLARVLEPDGSIRSRSSTAKDGHIFGNDVGRSKASLVNGMNNSGYGPNSPNSESDRGPEDRQSSVTRKHVQREAKEKSYKRIAKENS